MSVSILNLSGSELTSPSGNDVLLGVDVSDTSESPQGTTKWITLNTTANFTKSKIGTYNATPGGASVGSLVPAIGSGDSTKYLNSLGQWATPANNTYEIMGSGNGYAPGLVPEGQAFSIPSLLQNGRFLDIAGNWSNMIGYEGQTNVLANAVVEVLTNAGAASIVSGGDTTSIEVWITSNRYVIIDFTMLIQLTKNTDCLAFKISIDLAEIVAGTTYQFITPSNATFFPVNAGPEEFNASAFLPTYSGRVTIESGTTLTMYFSDVSAAGTSLTSEQYRIGGSLIGRFSLS